MGELQHGIYDDECEGLTHEEINTFYGFGEGGELQVGDEDPDQSEQDQEEDRSDNYKESEANMELDEAGSGDIIDSDHGFDPDIEACLS